MLRIAIIGCGKIADGHVEQVRAIGRGEVVAVCDSEPLMAEQLAARMAIPARYTDAQTMLRECRPDVVHIATPPESHVSLATMAIEFGCHVFVEKPFALTASDAQIILDAARKMSKRVSVNYLYNFETPGLELEGLLARGALGDIVHLDTLYGYNLQGDYGLAVMSDPGHWVHRLPGRLFHNVLDHVLAKVVAHLGDDVEAKVLAFRRRPTVCNPVLDGLMDELRFMLRSGGTTVSGLISAHSRPVAHALRVVGTRDTVELDYTARTLVRAVNWSQPSALGRLFLAFERASAFRRNGWRNISLFRRHEFHYFQGMRVLLTRFYDAIEAGSSDPIPPEHILRVCRVIDLMVESMEGEE